MAPPIRGRSTDRQINLRICGYMYACAQFARPHIQPAKAGNIYFHLLLYLAVALAMICV